MRRTKSASLLRHTSPRISPSPCSTPVVGHRGEPSSAFPGTPRRDLKCATSTSTGPKGLSTRACTIPRRSGSRPANEGGSEGSKTGNGSSSVWCTWPRSTGSRLRSAHPIPRESTVPITAV